MKLHDSKLRIPSSVCVPSFTIENRPLATLLFGIDLPRRAMESRWLFSGLNPFVNEFSFSSVSRSGQLEIHFSRGSTASPRISNFLFYSFRFSFQDVGVPPIQSLAFFRFLWTEFTEICRFKIRPF